MEHEELHQAQGSRGDAATATTGTVGRGKGERSRLAAEAYQQYAKVSRGTALRCPRERFRQAQHDSSVGCDVQAWYRLMWMPTEMSRWR